jgi:hypothetical protein
MGPTWLLASCVLWCLVAAGSEELCGFSGSPTHTTETNKIANYRDQSLKLQKYAPKYATMHLYIFYRNAPPPQSTVHSEQHMEQKRGT